MVGSSGLAAYTGSGPRFTEWAIDEETLTLTELSTVQLPAKVQYAWSGADDGVWYVVSSDGAGRSGPAGSAHHLSAVARSEEGGLAVRGEPHPLPSRPIHVSLDPSGRYALVAFNTPPAVRVYRVLEDGTIGDEVLQQPGLELGNYPHQVLTTPDGRIVLVTSLGQDANQKGPEEPGRITVLDFDGGRLSRPRAVAPNDGYGFGPRHLDVHANGAWVYVALERQNELALFDLEAGALSPLPRATRPLLRTTAANGIKQKAGAVHLHPRGHVVYAANRSDQIAADAGGGDDSIVVFALDERGIPDEIQHVDTLGAHCRTFQLDREGRILAAAHIRGRTAQEQPALSIFRVQDDGRLAFGSRHLIQTNGDPLFWAGIRPTQGTSDNGRPT